MGEGRVAPGATLGILGGGQLGRMTALAAARLGYRCHIYSPEADSPAALVSAASTIAAYDDPVALDAFARAVDVVTYEFENIPLDTVRRLDCRVRVRPGLRALEIAQDRNLEKSTMAAIGVATGPNRPVRDAASLVAAVAEIGTPAVLKTARLGYDGKGQRRIEADTDLAAVWAVLGTGSAVLEAFIDFSSELSVIVARGLDGAVATYDPVENRHVNHILDTTIAPAALPAKTAARARDIAVRLAEALNVVGLLAVEMFLTPDCEILVNEVAPRPHNSGHWTMDACAVSQFEQVVRAVCGLPLGRTERHSDAVMQNLLGDAIDAWPEILAEPGAILHLYGKTEARPGRKMGHVTRLSPHRTAA